MGHGITVFGTEEKRPVVTLTGSRLSGPWPTGNDGLCSRVASGPGSDAETSAKTTVGRIIDRAQGFYISSRERFNRTAAATFGIRVNKLIHRNAASMKTQTGL